MSFLGRFKPRGGVHPQGRKELSADEPIRTLPLPERLYVSLQQHVGGAATPVVKIGERVLKGQLVATSQGAISAPVHAPTSGRIAAIGDFPAPHPSGLPVPTITIEADGKDLWLDVEPHPDPFAMSPDEIAAGVGGAGIVGMGGAAFPSAVKLDISRKSGVQTLIINGGECEPYLTCDDRLMRERATEIVMGIRLIQYAVGARQAIVGIEDNKPDATLAMKYAAVGTDIRIETVPAMYPMGWDKQLTRALIGKEVPAGGRSADIGVLVHNVATAYAVQQAIVLGRPLVSRIVTVSGGAVTIPRNLEVLVGTPADAIFDRCNGFSVSPARLVMGGPMMGHEISSLHVPIIKGTSGLLALTEEEIGQITSGPCIRCSTCVRACPVGLLPLEMAARIRANEFEAAVEFGLKDCIGCGSCSYVCPAHIPLAHYFDYAKGELAAKERAKLKQEATRKLAEERTARMERIKREREEAAARRRAVKEMAEGGTTQAVGQDKETMIA